MNLIREVSDLVAESVIACIFGQSMVSQLLPYIQNDDSKMITIGDFMRKILFGVFRRVIHPVRIMMEVFDNSFINKSERENYKNV